MKDHVKAAHHDKYSPHKSRCDYIASPYDRVKPISTTNPYELQSDAELYEGSQPTKRSKHKEQSSEKHLDLSKELAALKD